MSSAQNKPEEKSNHDTKPNSTSQQIFNGVRVTTHSVHSFPTIMSHLYKELGSPSEIQHTRIMKSIKSYDAASKEAFTDSIKKAIGSHNLMLVQVRFPLLKSTSLPHSHFDVGIRHAAYLPLFIPKDRVLGLKRLILGNLLMAQELLQLDTTAALFVPIELLVREVSESEGGGTDLMYVLPSSLIAGVYVYEGMEGMREFLAAAERLEDGNLRGLVESVAFGDA